MTKCKFCKTVDISFNYDLPDRRTRQAFTIWDNDRQRPHDCAEDPRKKNSTDWMIAGRDYDPKWYGAGLCWHCGCKHHVEDMIFFKGRMPCMEVMNPTVGQTLGYDGRCVVKYN